MPGLLPIYRPRFSPKELAQAREVSRKRTAPHSMVLRANLALLLVQHPAVTNPEAGRRLGLHENTVRQWRKRWASDGFSLQDLPRSGRPPVFSPRRDRPDQGGRVRTARAT